MAPDVAASAAPANSVRVVTTLTGTDPLGPTVAYPGIRATLVCTRASILVGDGNDDPALFYGWRLLPDCRSPGVCRARSPGRFRPAAVSSPLGSAGRSAAGPADQRTGRGRQRAAGDRRRLLLRRQAWLTSPPGDEAATAASSRSPSSATSWARSSRVALASRAIRMAA